MPVEVELDIFSGLPNPTWVLNQEQEAELLSRLHALQPTPEKYIPEPPPLGYRGFIVLSPAGPNSSEPVKVYGGVVQRAGGEYRDPRRALEKWLLGTARSAIEANLKVAVSKELEWP